MLGWIPVVWLPVSLGIPSLNVGERLAQDSMSDASTPSCEGQPLTSAFPKMGARGSGGGRQGGGVT